MKRLLALLLLMLTVALCFVGCDGEEGKLPSDATDGGEETNGTEAVVQENPMVISENGAYKYAIIYPAKTPDSVKEMCKGILNEVAKLGGTVKMGSDWAKEKQDTSEDTEILIGNTSRPESIEVLNSIGGDEYAIRYIRNKIVIAAHTETRLAEAVEYFKTNLLAAKEEDGKKIVYCAGEASISSDRELLFNAENPIDGYRIIYSKAAGLALSNAKMLAKAIEETYGVKLEVLSDRTEPVEREIIVGMTSREASQKYLTPENSGSYHINVEGKTLIIGGYEHLVTHVALDDIIANDIRGYGSCLPYTTDYERSVPMFSDKAELAEGADIRVFSFNVLFNTSIKNPTPLERSACLVNIMKYFEPDVMGLQEMNIHWHNAYKDVAPDNYKLVNEKTEAGVLNYSTIAYNVNKVKVIDNGVKTYTKRNHDGLRVASWALFEKLDSGERFILINTHWDIESNFQMPQAIEMGELAVELKAKYGCPIITTGDYNRRPSTLEYKKYVEITGFVNAQDVAKTSGNLGASTHGADPFGTLPSASNIEAIDHIFSSTDAEFMYFTILYDKFALEASDHCPVYADIKLN